MCRGKNSFRCSFVTYTCMLHEDQHEHEHELEHEEIHEDLHDNAHKNNTSLKVLSNVCSIQSFIKEIISVISLVVT